MRDLLIKLDALNEHKCLSYFVAYAFKVGENMIYIIPIL